MQNANPTPSSSGRPSQDAAVRGSTTLAIAHALSYLLRNSNGAVVGQIMRDLHIDGGALGLLTAMYLLAFAAMQLPVGVLLLAGQSLWAGLLRLTALAWFMAPRLTSLAAQRAS